MIPRFPRLQEALARGPLWQLRLFAIATAFCVYFSMYAFRKPFAAGTYSGAEWATTGLGLKTVLVIGQIFGYTLAKFLGSRICSQATRDHRSRWLFGLIVAAESCLVLFGMLPEFLKPVAMFLNGLSLGMIWGLVVRYLEGRRASEVLLAGLSCSFIIASGVVKDVGRWLMSDHGIPEMWMPAATGLIFLLPFWIALTLLDHLPEPDEQDQQERSRRSEMDAHDRRVFLRTFPLGFALLLVVYTLVTAFRDYRDNFGVEILTELGYGEAKGIFSSIEVPVAFVVISALALFSLVPGGRKGMLALFVMLGAGAVTMLVSTELFSQGSLTGKEWMLAIGIGSYLVYVPFGSVLFERIAATLRFKGNAVFAIMVADGVGYLGSTILLIYQDLGYSSDETSVNFMTVLTRVTAVVCVVGFAAAAIYFDRHYIRGRDTTFDDQK